MHVEGLIIWCSVWFMLKVLTSSLHVYVWVFSHHWAYSFVWVTCLSDFWSSTVYLVVGCQVPADLRIVEMFSNQLRVDQAILTGAGSAVYAFIKKINMHFSWEWYWGSTSLLNPTTISGESCSVAKSSERTVVQKAVYQDKTSILFSVCVRISLCVTYF